MACEERFIQQLRERGMRMTPQRELILAALHRREGLFTAEELCAQVQEQCAGLKLSTVYRTLELLESLQLAAVVDVTDGRRHYELLGVHGLHHHLRCLRCGTVAAVPHAAIQPLFDQWMQAYGFAVEAGSLTFQGLCAECRKA